MAIGGEAGLTTENPIDPGLPICDPHIHVWDHPPHGRYLAEDLLQDTGSAHRVLKTVFVECSAMYREHGAQEMRPVGETEFVRQLAVQAASDRSQTVVAAGIVGFADLTLGAAVVPVLEAHIAAGEGRFRGIRHSAAWDPSPDVAPPDNVPPRGLLSDPSFREGFGVLQRYGLSYDVWLYHTQLQELIDLARAFPDTTIILNHVGGPLGVGPYAGKRKEVFEEWSRGIEALATCANVAVKLGGLGMPLCGFDWHDEDTKPGSAELAEAMAPYFIWCIEQFGARRCMFESNFPVDKMSYSYSVLWNAFKRMSTGFSHSDRAALFHDTAVSVYRLATDTDIGLH